jgi:uncharacterized membrane protein YtjA (UPF0391 family)
MMPSGPHSSSIGAEESVTMSTAVLRLCGQDDIGPSPVVDQSNDWMRAFIALGWGIIMRTAPVQEGAVAILRKLRGARYLILNICVSGRLGTPSTAAATREPSRPCQRFPPNSTRQVMGNLLYWAIVFLIIALIAAFLGFGGVAGVATEGARLLFWIAIILVVVSFIGGMLRRG